MTKASQEGQLLDFIAASLVANEYYALLPFPDQIEKAIRQALARNDLTQCFDKLHLDVLRNDVMHIIHAAPRKKWTHYSNWYLDENEYLQWCEMKPGTTPQFALSEFAKSHGTIVNPWETASNEFIESLESEGRMNPLVSKGETFKQAQERVQSRG